MLFPHPKVVTDLVEDRRVHNRANLRWTAAAQLLNDALENGNFIGQHRRVMHSPLGQWHTFIQAEQDRPASDPSDAWSSSPHVVLHDEHDVAHPFSDRLRNREQGLTNVAFKQSSLHGHSIPFVLDSEEEQRRLDSITANREGGGW